MRSGLGSPCKILLFSVWGLALLVWSIVPSVGPEGADVPLRVALQLGSADRAAGERALAAAEQLLLTPPVEVELVAFGPGVELLGRESVQARMAALAAQGVRFRACELSLQAQDLQSLPPQAQQIPSGFKRLADLDRQGYTLVVP